MQGFRIKRVNPSSSARIAKTVYHIQPNFVSTIKSTCRAFVFFLFRGQSVINSKDRANWISISPSYPVYAFEPNIFVSATYEITCTQHCNVLFLYPHPDEKLDRRDKKYFAYDTAHFISRNFVYNYPSLKILVSSYNWFKRYNNMNVSQTKLIFALTYTQHQIQIYRQQHIKC